MKLEEVLIEFEGLDGAGLGVGGFDLPGNELGLGIKYRIFGVQLKGILRLGPSLFAAAVKLQGIENEEIVERKTRIKFRLTIFKIFTENIPQLLAQVWMT